ncbi:hypothetical protein SLA2020_232200 [Shorea laevis]
MSLLCFFGGSSACCRPSRVSSSSSLFRTSSFLPVATAPIDLAKSQISLAPNDSVFFKMQLLQLFILLSLIDSSATLLSKLAKNSSCEASTAVLFLDLPLLVLEPVEIALDSL